MELFKTTPVYARVDDPHLTSASPRFASSLFPAAHPRGCFELFGFDFLLDNDFTPFGRKWGEDGLGGGGCAGFPGVKWSGV